MEKLRLKPKKVTNKAGKHVTNYGKEGEKYWFDRESISNIIKPNVNRNQIRKLSPDVISTFNIKVKDVLQYFGYDLIHPKKKDEKIGK